MADFTISSGNKQRQWSESKLQKKLENLAKAEKKTVWIHGNLNTEKSSWLGRIIWSVAKHFNFLRNIFYKIDLNKSKNILEKLQPQLISSGNTQLIELYKKAVSAFNLIAPKHAVKEELKTLQPKQSKPLVDVAKTISNEAQPVISQPSVVDTSKPESINTTHAPEKEAFKPTLPLSKEAAELKKKISLSYQGKISEEEALKRITGKPPGTFLYFTNDKNSYSFLIYVDDQKKNIMTKLSKSSIDKELEDFVKSSVLKSPIVLNPKKIQVLNPNQKVNVKTPLPESPTASKNKETQKSQPLSIKQQIALADHGVLPDSFAKSLLQGRDPGTFLVFTDPNSQQSEHVTISLAYVMPNGTVCNSGVLEAELEKHIQAYPDLFKIPLDKSISEIPQPAPSPTPPKESPNVLPKAHKGPQLNTPGSKKDPSIPATINPIPPSPPLTQQKSLIQEEAQKIGLTGKAALAYHGTMPAAEAKKLLEGQKPGSFLLFRDVIEGKPAPDSAVTIYGLFSNNTINDNQVLANEADYYLTAYISGFSIPLQPTQQANASYNPDKYLTPEVSATVTATIGPNETKEKLKAIQIPVPKEIMEILVKQQLAKVSALGLKGKAALAYQDCISDDVAGKFLSGQKPGTYLVHKVNETDSSYKICWLTKDNILTNKLCDNVDEANSFCNASPSECVFALPALSLQNNIINLLSAVMQNPIPVMLAKGLKVKEAVEKGVDKDNLLVQAVQNGEIENAAWLIKQGASLATLCKLNNKTEEEKAIFDWLFKVFLPMPVTPETLNDYALGMGYGYKAANLMVLESKAAKMNESLKASEVKVPPFLPISDFELQNYATKGCPELLNLWEEFKNSFEAEQKEKFLTDPVNNSLKISPKGQEILFKIQKQIVQHFANNRYFTLQMEEWIKKEKFQFIIVRSTGKEDSDTNSNAGGNASIPFIKPDPLALSIAIGQVLASYFAEKSISQRLLAGDLSLFTEKKPFMPVLLQVMIGENIGGQGSKDEDIPRSGVLFTRQEDKADGVTLIQTGLGNNEGVVTSSVPVDTYYVGDDQNIHAVVKRKTIRYVSVAKENKFKAEPIKNNNPALENSQALPDNVILDLKKVADEVSKGYGIFNKETLKPMDMEYTVKLKDPSSSKPVIYLLQARPLLKVQNMSDKPNSFTNLSLLKNINQKDKVAAKTLLDGNSYVRKVESNQDIIFCNDLTSALIEYSKLDNSKTVKTIVIKKPAPSTSHEAVILRPKGVAVLVIEDPQQFEQAKSMASKASAESPILVDPQRGVIFNPNETKNWNTYINKGLISYPIPLELSVPKKGLLMIPSDKFHPGKTKLELWAKMTTLDNTYKNLVESLLGKENPISLKDNGSTLHELIDRLAMSDSNPKIALATILITIHKRLLKSMHDAEPFRAGINMPMYHVFESIIHLVKNEVIPAIEKYPPQSMNRLYPIKFLEALIFQQPGPDVVGGFSYATVLKTDAMEKKLVAKAKSQGYTYEGPDALNQLQLQKMGSAAFSPECEKNWNTFVQQLVDLKQKGMIPDLSKFINKVQALKMDPIWLNIFFNKIWKLHEGKLYQKGEGFPNQAVDVLGKLINAYAYDEPHLDWIANRHKDLDFTEQQIEQWGDPSFVAKNLSMLKDLFVNKMGFHADKEPVNQLKTIYEKSSTLGSFALLQFMRRTINIYDQIIKAVKGSTKYTSEKQRIKDLALMLQGYFQMMEAAMALISPADEKAMMKPNMGMPVSFSNYIQNLHQGTSYKFGFCSGKPHASVGFDKLLQDAMNEKLEPSKQLEARPEFSVESFTIGSKADLNFSSHWPARLEEYFTVFHQNIEKVAKFLNTKLGLNTSVLPEAMQNICTPFSQKFKAEISAINAEGSHIEVAYQIPLRQHSSTILIKYNTNAPEKGLDLSVHMFGNDEHDRWDQGATCGALLANLGPDIKFTAGIPPKINYDAPDNKRESVFFSLHLPQNYANQAKLVDSLHFMLKSMSMSSVGGPKGLESYAQKVMGPIDWKTVNDSFFADSFYLNTYLLENFSKSQDYVTVLKIAKNSLLGLARQGVKDYTLHAVPKNLDGIFNDPEYSYVPGNALGGKGLKLVATLNLIKALDEAPIPAMKAIKELTENPDMKAKLPETVKALNVALQSITSPEEKYALLMKEGKYAQAYILAAKYAEQTPNDNLKNEFKKFIEQMKTDSEVKALIAITKEVFKTHFKYADQLCCIIFAMQPLVKDELLAIKKSAIRYERLKDLSANVAKLQALAKANDFDKNYEEIMDLSVDGLIGLSQHSNFHENFGNFEGLKEYLAQPKYTYVYENKHTSTNKLRKAAVLYLIKGLESTRPKVLTAAVEAYHKLIKDYLSFSKNSPHAEDIKNVLIALTRAHIQACKNSKDPIENILLGLSLLSETNPDFQAIVKSAVNGTNLATPEQIQEAFAN